MARDWEVDALARILTDDANVDKTVEELAVELIEALDQLRGLRERIAVILQYTLDQGTTLHHAALGPYPAGARDVAVRDGQGIAGRYTRVGTGRFMIVPVYGSTREAWDAIDPPRAVRPVPPTPAGFNPRDHRGPACLCGHPAGTACPRHPERNH